MSESPVVKNTQKEACRLKMRLLRNNRGQFYTMDKKRIVRAGLEAPGSSDLIGITTMVITQEMVGAIVGVATVVESKEPNWTYKGTEHEKTQKNFIDQVVKRGGIGFFLNNHENLKKEVDAALKRFIV